MLEKRLGKGRLAYYWSPNKRDMKAGCPVGREALGLDYGTAIERAKLLNRHLDAWRRGLGTIKNLDTGPQFGTLTWLFEEYKRTAAYERVSARTRPEYDKEIKRLALWQPIHSDF
jgi:hypothetical protein